MKKKNVDLLFSLLFLLFSVTPVSAASVSVYLGGPTTGGDLELAVSTGVTYNFEAYINVPTDVAGSGLFGAGIAVRYNPAFFALYEEPTIDGDNFSLSSSKIIYPNDDLLDNVVNNSFAFYAQDYEGLGLSGEIHIGNVSFRAIEDCILGDWLIMTGESSTNVDFLTYDSVVLDGDIDFYGANCPAVPIPSTLLLLGTGLMGLMGLRRRK